MNEREDSGSGGRLFLSEDEVTTVARVLENILQTRDPSGQEGEGAPRPARKLAGLAKNVLLARKQRRAFLSPSLMGEPAWDMLLAIYIHAEGMPVTEAVEHSGAAPTTALRWLEHLKDHGLIEKSRNDSDRRIWLVRISEKGRAALDAYFKSLPLDSVGAG